MCDIKTNIFNQNSLVKMDTDWTVIKELDVHKNHDHFWKCINILVTKSFALNRNIGGCNFFNLGVYSEEKISLIKNHITCILRSCNQIEFNEIKKQLEHYLSIPILSASSMYKDLCNWNGNQPKVVLFLRLTFPKNGVFRSDIFDLIHCDYCTKTVIFTKLNKTSDKPHLLVDIPYRIKYQNGLLSLSVSNSVEHQSEALHFLETSLFSKLSSWFQSNLKNEQIYSLSLVQVDDYMVLYNELKRKYVHGIKQIWTECTNVEKFIHEDIAIATYLIILWNKKPQKFVDLGCGNGLLVYILNTEGHQGIGIDVRARKIWSNYPSTTILKVQQIVPSDNSLFPDADWIIGNHSDELTPWIPVIAMRSSYKTNFFLLPCCAYEFDGRKYVRNDASKSVYLDYMDYVEEICRKCGFNVCQDRLRIPSTKRICFVSFDRKYSKDQHEKIDKEVVQLIKNQSVTDITDSCGKWLNNYKPREAKEKVLNCTQLDKKLIDELVNGVAQLLLNNNDNSDEKWNEGTPMKLSDTVKSLPVELLEQLKNECGGLQTVLRNHHSIFLLENGVIKFRKPIEREINKDRWKRKPCWFFNNHPDSCPLSDEKCSYIHQIENCKT